jgi:hypothetical protein
MKPRNPWFVFYGAMNDVDWPLPNRSKVKRRVTPPRPKPEPPPPQPAKS